MDSSTSGRVTGCQVLIPAQLQTTLFAHLFPGDNDEHGAVLAAGIAVRNGVVRFLVREVFRAIDGVDYVPGRRGHRELHAEFIGRRIADCRNRRLAYLAVHNHGGNRDVAFSGIDMASHERGYPALLELLQGVPVGALVFARSAAAGDIWFPGGPRLVPTEVRIVGPQIDRWTSGHDTCIAPAPSPEFDRQLLMFGATGQARLRELTVGVIGLGGVGSLVTEYLAKLGVGRLILADPERIEISNVSRIVGSTRWDARWPLTGPGMPKIVREAAQRLATRKTAAATRLVHRTAPATEVVALAANVATHGIAKQFLGCDYVFLAADSAQARLIFNAIVNQYYVPGFQIGSKIVSDDRSGELTGAFSVVRRLWPGFGCLWCSGLIAPDRLAWESKSATEQQDQTYGTAAPSPSVITVNAVGAAQAVNEFLFSVLSLREPTSDFWWGRTFDHMHSRVLEDHVSPHPECPECSGSATSRLGIGDARPLPTVCNDHMTWTSNKAP